MTDKRMTFDEYQQLSRTVHARVDRIVAMIDRQLRDTGHLAGLGRQCPAHLAHNALCGLHYGKPWSEVNYPLARKVLWLQERSFEPSRIADRILSRAIQRTIR